MNIDGLYRCETCNFDTKYSQNLHAHFRSQKHLVNTGSKIEEFNDENIDETEEYGNTCCQIFNRGLWGCNIRKIFVKNQYTERKLMSFENWCSGELSKIGHHFIK